MHLLLVDLSSGLFSRRYSEDFSLLTSSSTPTHDVHKARRQTLNPFFSKAKVTARQDIIYRNVEKLCGRISQFAGNTVNLGGALSAIARDIACEFVLDKTYDNLGEEDFNVGMTNMLQRAGFIWRVTKHVRWFGPLFKSFGRNLMMKVTGGSTKVFLEYLQVSLSSEGLKTKMVSDTRNSDLGERARYQGSHSKCRHVFSR